MIEDKSFAHEQGCSDESIDVSVQRELTMEQTHAQDEDEIAMEITVQIFRYIRSHENAGRNDGVDGEVEHSLPLESSVKYTCLKQRLAHPPQCWRHLVSECRGFPLV